MMAFDATWVGFGLFLLACGAVPAFVALSAERRAADAPNWGVGRAGLFQEAGHGATPAELARIRATLAALQRDLPALPGYRVAFALDGAGRAAGAAYRPAASSITPESRV